MELFPENHSPYEKDFVTKSNPYAKFSARHFTKKFVSWRICQESGSPHFFDGNSLPNTTLQLFVFSRGKISNISLKFLPYTLGQNNGRDSGYYDFRHFLNLNIGTP